MKKILKLAFALFLFSCKSPTRENVNPVSLPVREEDFEDERFKLSNIIEKVELIPLQTLKASLISNIDKIVEFDQGFLIFDRPGTDKVLQFDATGKFVKSIGTTGHGPDELVNMADFYYDPNVGTLYILDNAGELTVKKFELASGKFLGKLALKNCHGTRFTKLENGNWAFSGVYNSKPIGFFITDSTLTNVLFTDIVVERYSMAFGVPDEFSRSANKVLFRTGEQSTIFNVGKNGDSLEPYLFVDFEKKATREMYAKAVEESKGSDIMEIPHKLEDKMHYIFHFVDNSKYTFFNFFYKKKLNYVFYNKSNKHKLVIPENYFQDDISSQGSKGFALMSNSFDGTSVISFLSSLDLARLKEGKEPSTEIGAAVYQQLKSLPEDSNPVIIKYRFKDF